MWGRKRARTGELVEAVAAADSCHDVPVGGREELTDAQAGAESRFALKGEARRDGRPAAGPGRRVRGLTPERKVTDDYRAAEAELAEIREAVLRLRR
ncbi:hypothetical protein GCM10020367_33550 [Streptomyces sannanensis]|uniref:Transposase n=1 Tax=Streptomyces sannanensis TaxID=285536 RepID=A0ABP6SD74_9ACTN